MYCVRCIMPELARLLARSESIASRDVLDCRLLLTSKFLSAGKPLAVRIRSKTGGPGECAPNRGSHGQTVSLLELAGLHGDLHVPHANLRNAIITAAWQLARSAHSTVERRRRLITSLPVNVDVAIKTQLPIILCRDISEDTDAPYGRKGSDTHSPTTGNKHNRYAIALFTLYSEASKFVAVWLTEFRVAFQK